MISRSRSAPTAAAMSIECTTSAKRTVTCLYSAWVSCSVTGAPQPSQNRAPSRGSVPHVRQAVAAVIAPFPAGHQSTPRRHDLGRLALRRADRRSRHYRVTAGQTCLSYQPCNPLRPSAELMIEPPGSNASRLQQNASPPQVSRHAGSVELRNPRRWFAASAPVGAKVLFSARWAA
jgi:hypothetical protein